MRALVLCLLLLAGCSMGGGEPTYLVDPSDLADIDLGAGSTEESVRLGGGPRMSFILDVPPEASGGDVPLVVAMPYAGEAFASARQYHAILAQPGLSDLGAIVVVPVAFDVTWQTEAAVTAVSSFVRAAVEAWPVDAERVAVTGYSNGGNGAWAQAAEHADLYAAAIPMGAFAPRDAPVGIPFYVIHGENDELVPIT
ncbi:MAG: dienelactone hydrolase family protein, partial [Bacteroidota bacterium]